MSEIFPSHQESAYPSNEGTWRQELGINHPTWSDHRWNGLPGDTAYPLESTTLPEDFEEVTEITEVDETASSSPASTADKQAKPSVGMNQEEVARARALVARMFSGHSNKPRSHL